MNILVYLLQRTMSLGIEITNKTKAFTVCEKLWVFMLMSQWYLLGYCSAGLKCNTQTLNSSLQGSMALPITETPNNHLVTFLKIIRLEGVILFSGHYIGFRSLLWCGWTPVCPVLPVRRRQQNMLLEEYSSV